MQILLQVFVFFFLPFSIVFFCLWLRKSDFSFLSFYCVFFSFYNKGIQMLFVCARYESLCTCSSTSSCNLNHKKKKLDINSAPHPLGHHIVKCELEVWFW